ncbi:MAG: hypothetical protein MUP55_02115 [Candidatus Aenigmarchaeota archaeon]|nr:hypothetical protein [Candidatus Aenigmarchaeota archaeon]
MTVGFLVGGMLTFLALYTGIIPQPAPITDAEPARIETLIVLSLALTFGIGYGFDNIYDKKLTDRLRLMIEEFNSLYKLQKRELISLKRKLKKSRINQLTETFIEDIIENRRKTTVEEILGRYNTILNFRKYLFSVMYMSSIFFVFSLFYKFFMIPGFLFFILGLLILTMFMVSLYSLLDKISYFEVTKGELRKDAKKFG